jgi:predicted nucleic acid-binding protein
VDRRIAEKFGEIRARLLDHGRSVAGMDLLIAATALIHDLTLVTHNTIDFRSIPDLRLSDWIAP